MLSGKDYPIAEKVTNFQRQRARADRSRRKTDTYAQDSVRIQDAELPDYHDSGLDDDGYVPYVSFRVRCFSAAT